MSNLNAQSEGESAVDGVNDVRERVVTRSVHEREIRDREKDFKESLSRWRRTSNKLQKVLSAENPIESALRELQTQIDEDYENVHVNLHELKALCADEIDPSLETRYDEIEIETNILLKRVGETLTEMVSERKTLQSRKSSVLSDVRKCDDFQKQFSNTDKETSMQRVQNYVNDIPEDPHANSLDLLKSLAHQAQLNRLPVPEPNVFMGDPLKYAEWKHSFQVLIEGKGVSPMDKIHYLKMYVGGTAKECLEGFFLFSSPNAYDEAREVLEERFGNDFIVSNAFRDKLEQWPKISNRDNAGLRKFSDFLRQCYAAMMSIKGLEILNDERENQKLLMKIPEALVGRWARKADDYFEKHKRYPPFSKFVKFMAKEAKLANDPITSLSSLKGDKVISRDNQRSERARTMVANSNVSGEKKAPKCTFCEKPHFTDLCRGLGSKTSEEKNQFVKANRLCFRCLKRGHISKKCRSNVLCNECKQRHATAMCNGKREVKVGHSSIPPKISFEDHVEVPEFVPKAVAESQVLSSRASNGGTCKSSMIVPVYVSHQEAPQHEVLVYALLDTQSDSSFILNETAHSLNVKGQPVDLKLSTMLAENALIKSEKIAGLQVRGYRGGKTINLPPTYTREIMPAEKSHIPTSEMAMKWPYLTHIAGELEPVRDCNIGLLIGYDCAKALAPIKVIPPKGDGPYAKKTELGWAIVGVIETGASNDTGTSHRMLTQIVSNEIESNEIHVSLNLNDPEVKKCRTLANSTKTLPGLDSKRFEHIPNWNRLKRVVAICLKFGKELKTRSIGQSIKSEKQSLYDTIKVSDLQEAETKILQLAQRESFQEELQALQTPKAYVKEDSVLSRLDCFLDGDGLIRVGGRLRQSRLHDITSCPVVIPKSGHITNLIVECFHKSVHHQGKGVTLNKIRSNGFWIVNANAVVAKFIFNCVTCRKHRGKLQSQKMSDLPQDRTEPAPPFSQCSVDFFGSFCVKRG